MSIKSTQDKDPEHYVRLHHQPGGMDFHGDSYPWTARQRRRAKSSRKTRKQDRAGRIAAKFAKKKA